jgi:periplasmic copper chaperone A
MQLRRLVILAAACIAVVGSLAPARAADVMVMGPWARATPPGAKVGAGYMTLHNAGAAGDRLVSASSDVADHVEIQETSIDNGVTKMRELPRGLEIPAGKAVELKPGGYHLMLMGLKQPLKAGEMVKAIVTFEKAGAMPVELKVEAVGASTGAPSGGAGHDKH